MKDVTPQLGAAARLAGARHCRSDRARSPRGTRIPSWPTVSSAAATKPTCFSERHVQHPVQVVLDLPMPTNHSRQYLCVRRKTRDVRSSFGARRLARRALRLDHYHASKVGPAVRLLEPSDLSQDPDPTHLQTTVSLVDLLRVAQRPLTRPRPFSTGLHEPHIRRAVHSDVLYARLRLWSIRVDIQPG